MLSFGFMIRVPAPKMFTLLLNYTPDSIFSLIATQSSNVAVFSVGILSEVANVIRSVAKRVQHVRQE